MWNSIKCFLFSIINFCTLTVLLYVLLTMIIVLIGGLVILIASAIIFCGVICIPFVSMFAVVHQDNEDKAKRNVVS